MARLRLSVLAAICWIVPAASVRSAPAPGAPTGLEQVPASAPIVFYLRGVQGTHDRFVTMMENALPDVLKMFQNDMDNWLKDGSDGRKLRGLAQNGPHFFAITHLPKPEEFVNGPPPFAFILAVSDYKEFRDNLLTETERKDIKDKGKGIESATFEGKTLYFVERKGFAILTPNEEVAESFTKKQPGLNTTISKEQGAKLLAADAGVYVNMDAVNKVYGEQIKEGKEAIERALTPLAQIGDDSQKKMVAMFTKAIGPIFQAVGDMHSFLYTFEFRPGGLAVHLQSEINENTPTANLLTDSRPVAFKELDKMPAGSAYYTGMKTSAALFKGLGSWMVSVPLGNHGDEMKEVAAALDELAKAGPSLRLDGYSFPMAGLQVYQYDDPAKAVAAQLKLFEAMVQGDPKEIGLKEKPVLKKDAEKYGDFQLNSVEFVWDFDKMAEPVAQQGEEAKKKFIEGMKGLLGDKVRIWFGTDGKTVVQIVAPSWDAAEKMLNRYRQGKDVAGDEKAYRAARKELPARTSFLGLIDAVQMFDSIWKAFEAMIPAGQMPAGFPNVPAKKTTSFVGMAVTLQPGRGSFDLFITAAAAQEFYKAIVKPLVGG